MVKMNSLELRLHSWQPRRPSAGLRRRLWRLFGPPASHMPQIAWLAGWWVPATGCALLTFSVFTSEHVVWGRLTNQTTTATGLLSNRTCSTPAPVMFRQGQNNLKSVTFDLTKRSSFPSSISAFPHGRVN